MAGIGILSIDLEKKRINSIKMRLTAMDENQDFAPFSVLYLLCPTNTHPQMPPKIPLAILAMPCAIVSLNGFPSILSVFEVSFTM